MTTTTTYSEEKVQKYKKAIERLRTSPLKTAMEKYVEKRNANSNKD